MWNGEDPPEVAGMPSPLDSETGRGKVGRVTSKRYLRMIRDTPMLNLHDFFDPGPVSAKGSVMTAPHPPEIPGGPRAQKSSSSRLFDS